jgi:hypothetical protein
MDCLALKHDINYYVGLLRRHGFQLNLPETFDRGVKGVRRETHHHTRRIRVDFNMLFICLSLGSLRESVFKYLAVSKRSYRPAIIHI